MSDKERYIQQALDVLAKRIGKPEAPSEWFEVTQERIDAYADVSMDHQWIHVDVARAADGPFGAPIAHGNLTLAVMDHLPKADAEPPPTLEGHRLSINYGYDRIRFPSPVKVGTRIRSTNTLVRAERKGDMIETATEIRVDIEGNDKPALVAEKLRRLVF